MACFKLNFLLDEKVELKNKQEDRIAEEYREAFRSRSFVDLCDKIQSHWGNNTSLEGLTSSPCLPAWCRQSSPALLLGPSHPSILDPLIEGPDDELCHFQIFFQISTEAGEICASILRSISFTRVNYINAVQRLLDQLEERSGKCHQNTLYRKLASFALVENSLSVVDQEQFEVIHNNLCLVLERFTSRGKKLRRTRKLRQWYKRIAGGVLVTACSALTIAILILAVHGTMGLVAVPGLAAFHLCFIPKKLKQTTRSLFETSPLQGSETELDIAAKGIYLLINDFDTISRLVTRLHDEIEHCQFMANLCLRRRNRELLKEAARDFSNSRNSVVSQLKELQNHICLCLLNIERSKRMLLSQVLDRGTLLRDSNLNQEIARQLMSSSSSISAESFSFLS